MFSAVNSGSDGTKMTLTPFLKCTGGRAGYGTAAGECAALVGVGVNGRLRE
jgi:hypothetical protein